MPDEPAAPPAPPIAPEAAAPGGRAAPRRGPGEGRNEQARNPLAFLVLVVVLCGAGWLLVSWMSDTTRIQDCVMSGKKNCAPLDPKLGR